MAKSVFTNAYVLINGVNLSDHVESLTTDFNVDDVEVTAMGDVGHRHLAGLQNNKFTVTFWQDFAASSVDATLSGIFTAGTAVAFKLGANGTVFSATNPSYSGSCILTGYQALAGKVGDAMQTQVPFIVDGGITRGTV